MNYKNMEQNSGGGFTLVEIIVAVALFAIVMLVAVGALLALTGANRRAQALQSVMNNLNISLDGMVRNARMGTNYHCGNPTFSNNALVPQDCPGGGTVFAFKPYCSPADTNCGCVREYYYDGQAKAIYRIDSDANCTLGTPLPITAPEVSIQSMTFYVLGTTPGDALQPKMLVIVQGQAGVSASAQTTFHIEAAAVQRQLDLKQ